MIRKIRIYAQQLSTYTIYNCVHLRQYKNLLSSRKCERPNFYILGSKDNFWIINFFAKLKSKEYKFIVLELQKQFPDLEVIFATPISAVCKQTVSPF